MNNNYNQGNMNNNPTPQYQQSPMQTINPVKGPKFPLFTTIAVSVVVVAGVSSVFIFKGLNKTDKVDDGKNISESNQSNQKLTATTNFQANVYMFTKEEGGRHTPFFNNYSPTFNFNGVEVKGKITLEEGIEMIMPGEEAFLSVKLESPVEMAEGTEFFIYESGRKLGRGVVSKEKNIVNKENVNTTDMSKVENISIGTVDPSTNLTYDVNGAFLMYIEDVFTITDRGTCLTGKVSRGTLKVGDKVQILGLDGEILNTTIKAIDMFRNDSGIAKVGDNVGIILDDVERKQVSSGAALVQINSMIATNNFEAEIYTFAEAEGGRKEPFDAEYISKVSIGSVKLDSLVVFNNKVNPASTVSAKVKLKSPVAMEVGTEFSILENGKEVAKGKVTKLN